MLSINENKHENKHENKYNRLQIQRLDIDSVSRIDSCNIDNYGTNNSTLSSLTTTYLLSRNETCEKITENTSVHNINIKVFRFKFNDFITNELDHFSKIHKYDNSTDYKDAWKIWVEENHDMVERETNRLNALGFEGDVTDKMFKSSRYYYRKKTEDKKEPQERREYIKIDAILLLKMDEHIKENVHTKDYQPKIGFLDFCKKNMDVLKDIIFKMKENGITDIQLIQNKIKKTYKNRYFTIVSNK